MLHNLVLNAIQAMPDGGNLQVVARNEELPGSSSHLPAGRYLRIQVSDSGVGIPSENLPKLFVPYFTTKPEGNGLGLATSYAVVRKHGGTISVASAPGMGTSFDVYLPASGGKAEALQDSVQPPTPGKGRLLVVDDEEIVRVSTLDMLAFLGYQADMAPDAETAIQMFEAAAKRGEPYDAVIMDLTIPGGMGGVQACARIQSSHPNAVVLVSSGYATDPAVANYRAHGFRGAISKPYGMQELAIALAEVLAPA